MAWVFLTAFTYSQHSVWTIPALVRSCVHLLMLSPDQSESCVGGVGGERAVRDSDCGGVCGL